MKKLWDLKNDLSYLELEGQGRGIIMEVTRPLLLRQFYLVKWPVNPNILAASVFCQTVAGISTTSQFHEFFILIFGGFLSFDPTVQWQQAVCMHPGEARTASSRAHSTTGPSHHYTAPRNSLCSSAAVLRKIWHCPEQWTPKSRTINSNKFRLGPNVSTTPITAMGCLQLFSWKVKTPLPEWGCRYFQTWSTQQ